MLPDTLMSIIPKGLTRDPADIQSLYSSSWAWDKLRTMMGSTLLYSSALPLPNARWVPILGEKLVQHTLKTQGMNKFGDLFPGDHVFSITETEHLSAGTFMDRFNLTRVKSALRAVCPDFPVEPASFAPLTTIIEAHDGTHLISKLYHTCSTLIPVDDSKIRGVWERDLGHSITDDQWEQCCMATGSISLNNRHKLLHYKFLRRAYITPQQTHKIDPSRSHYCRKCSAPQADFIHLAWTCPGILPYWTQVHSIIGQMIDLQLTPLPEVALLGYVVNFPLKIRKFIAMCFLLAKREIAIHWGDKRPPTTQSWLGGLPYCNTQSEVYVSTLPRKSRPKDILGPFKQYILNNKLTPNTQQEHGLAPTGIG